MYQFGVKDSARWVRQDMIKRADGRLPQTDHGWECLLKKQEIDVWISKRQDDDFTAKLIVHPRASVVILGRYLTPRQRMRAMCHELAEYIAITTSDPRLIDYYGEYHYDGGRNPRDFRHRVACEVERMTFPRLPLFWAIRSIG